MANIYGAQNFRFEPTSEAVIVTSIGADGTTVAGGQEYVGFELAGKNDKAAENILSLKIIIHPGETVTVAGSSANSATIKGSLLWKELF